MPVLEHAGRCPDVWFAVSVGGKQLSNGKLENQCPALRNSVKAIFCCATAG